MFKLIINKVAKYKINIQQSIVFLYTDDGIVGGTTDRKLSPWLGLIVITYMSYLTRGSPGKEKLTLYHQAEEFGKGQKERGEISVYVLAMNWTEPPKNLLTGVHLGWVMCAWPGRILHLNSCPETIQKPTPLPWKQTVSHMTEQFFRILYPATLCLGTPSWWSILLCQHIFSSDSSFLSVRQVPTLRPWKGSPFLQWMTIQVGFLHYDWHPESFV